MALALVLCLLAQDLSVVCATSEGKPAAGIEVVLSRPDGTGRVREGAYHTRTFVGREVARAKTDAQGRVAFASLEAGVYHVSAEMEQDAKIPLGTKDHVGPQTCWHVTGEATLTVTLPCAKSARR